MQWEAHFNIHISNHYPLRGTLWYLNFTINIHGEAPLYIHIYNQYPWRGTLNIHIYNQYPWRGTLKYSHLHSISTERPFSIFEFYNQYPWRGTFEYSHLQSISRKKCEGIPVDTWVLVQAVWQSMLLLISNDIEPQN